MLALRMERREREVALLHEVTKILLSGESLARRMRMTLQIMVDTLGLSRAYYALKNEASEYVDVQSSYGLSIEEEKRGHYRLGEGIIGKVVKSGTAMVIPDVSAEPVFSDRMEVYRNAGLDRVAFVCVPIRMKGDVLGALGADRAVAGPLFFEDDTRMLQTVASLMGQAILSARKIEQQKAGLAQRMQRLQDALRDRYRPENILGGSATMEPVFESIDHVRSTKATVLIRGESGTGKELVARAIHFGGDRAQQPFVKVVCAAIPETLLESGLFGHERGAFTGAFERKTGYLEVAHKGTVFLDEISEVPPSIQVKLLRFLQEKTFERVGDTKPIRVDVRVVAATNRSLEILVQEGSFREDLYYRLNVVPIVLPALRERRDDIPLLAQTFLERLSREYAKEMSFSPGALRKLQEYDWPGNIRELENLVERLAVLLPGGVIEAERLVLPGPGRTMRAPGGFEFRPGDEEIRSESLHSIEKTAVIAAMRQTNGNQAAAARNLGVSARQLRYRAKRFGIAIRSVSIE